MKLCVYEAVASKGGSISVVVATGENHVDTSIRFEDHTPARTQVRAHTYAYIYTHTCTHRFWQTTSWCFDRFLINRRRWLLNEVEHLAAEPGNARAWVSENQRERARERERDGEWQSVTERERESVSVCVITPTGKQVNISRRVAFQVDVYITDNSDNSGSRMCTLYNETQYNGLWSVRTVNNLYKAATLRYQVVVLPRQLWSGWTGIKGFIGIAAFACVDCSCTFKHATCLIASN